MRDSDCAPTKETEVLAELVEADAGVGHYSEPKSEPPPAWPPGGGLVDLDEILAPLRAAWDRMRQGQPAAYCGFEPTVGAAVRGGTLAEALSPERRARAAARGEDVVDGFLAAAYFLGLEQGTRYQTLAVQALALGALAELERHERARGSGGEAIECLYRCLGVDRAQAAAWPAAPPAPPARDARSLRERVAARLDRERGGADATPVLAVKDAPSPSSFAAPATLRAELAMPDKEDS